MKKEGAVAVASERKRGTVDGVVVARVCVVDFHKRTIKGFCRRSMISTIDLCVDDVRMNSPSKLERRTFMAKAIAQRSVWH